MGNPKVDYGSVNNMLSRRFMTNLRQSFVTGKYAIGIAAVGYADGYPRHARTGTPVSVAGKVVPLIGRVSMDMIAIDLTELLRSGEAGAISVGAPVTLWGESLPAEQVAMHADTIPYELVCAISQRVAIKYV